MTHDSANDAHEDIRNAIEGRVTQDGVETTAQRRIDIVGHASNVDLGRSELRIASATAITCRPTREHPTAAGMAAGPTKQPVTLRRRHRQPRMGLRPT